MVLRGYPYSLRVVEKLRQIWADSVNGEHACFASMKVGIVTPSVHQNDMCESLISEGARKLPCNKGGVIE